jgi:predicted RND superfamily exporter protein
VAVASPHLVFVRRASPHYHREPAPMLNQFYRRHSFRVMLMVVFALPVIGFGALTAVRSQRNNVEEWLPKGYAETTELAWFRDHFLGEQFALLSWEGCDRDDVRLHVLARKLVPEKNAVIAADYPPLFKSVITGASAVHQMMAPPLGLSEEEAVDRLQDALIKLHPPIEGENVKEGETAPPREQTCLIVTLTDHGKHHLKDAVEEILRQAEQSGLSEERLHMGGPPIDNYAIDTEGRKTLRKLAGWSGLIGLLLSYWCFRGIRLTMMVFSIGACSAITSLGIVGYYGMFEVFVLGYPRPLFGGVDAVLLSMPSLVYVLAISGAIHIVNYYRDACEESGEENAAARAIAHGWGPCSLAAITTAVGLASLCLSDLVPIKKFGIWSAAGVLATLVILFTMLPAWLKLWPPKMRAKKSAPSLAPSEGILALLGRRFVEMIIRRNGWVMAGCTAMLVFFAVGLTRTQTSVQLLKLFDPGSKIIADYTWLETNLGNLVPMEIVVSVPRDSERTYLERMQLIAEVQREIEKLDDVSKTMSLVTFAPSMPTKEDFKSKKGGAFRRLLGSRGYQYRKACRIYSDRLAKHRDEFLESDYLSDDGELELWRISCRVSALNDVNYGLFVDELKKAVDPVLAANQREDEATPLAVAYTGVVPLVYKSQTELLKGLITSTFAAFLLIAVVMMVVLRSIPAGLLAMVPNVFPLVTVFGAMAWLGLKIDIGTMMTASVAMGVAVDDTVHYLSWFRHGMREMGLDRRDATRLAYERCGRAMMQTTLVGGLGLLVFALSSFTPTQRFGYMMFLMLAAALVGDLVFLPAMLTGRIGRFFGKNLRRATPVTTVTERAPADSNSAPSTSPPPPHIGKTGRLAREIAGHQRPPELP